MIFTILSYTFTFVAIILTIAFTYFKWVYTYWARNGVPYREPQIPYGNGKPVIKEEKTFGQAVSDVYFEMKAKHHQFSGFYFFHMPCLIAIDTNLIKHILQNDFHHFVDHGVYYNEQDDPLSAHLFAIEGQKWRNLRIKLTPTFTSGKMKMMFPIILSISDHLKAAISNDKTIEIRQLAARFTTDIIGTCAFGIDCNSLADPNTEFSVQGRRVFQLTGYELARTFASFVMPDLARRFGARLLPEVSTDFFWKVIKENAAYREENNIRKNDVFQLLLDMKNGEEGLTFQELAAQAFIFFVAGYETSSLTMSYSLYELGRNEDVQEKLRDEINAVMKNHNGELTYDGIMEMHYMEMVIKETLRKYPPLSILNRVCTEDYKIPDSDVTLKKGTKVFIPVEGIHYDPEYFENPQEFIPERFLEENVNKRPHFTYLPFGDGPRVCIGLRFGVMQTKIGLATIIKNYRVKINGETKPIKMNPRHFINHPVDPILLDFQEI